MKDNDTKELERQDRERGKLLKKVLAGNLAACMEYLEKYGGKEYRLDDNARRLVFKPCKRKSPSDAHSGLLAGFFGKIDKLHDRTQKRP